jgi:hypothetical protein
VFAVVVDILVILWFFITTTNAPVSSGQAQPTVKPEDWRSKFRGGALFTAPDADINPIGLASEALRSYFLGCADPRLEG